MTRAAHAMGRVQHYRDPLSAYAAACQLPKGGEQRLVVVAGHSGSWNYLYPECADRALEVLTSFAKIVPENFDCFIRYMPRGQRNGRESKTKCILCGGLGLEHHP